MPRIRWHHGNLLPELVRAADHLLGEGGRAAVTLRAVAASIPKGRDGTAPVAHTAAMAHVSGVLELLAHLAAARWEQLAAHLEDIEAPSPAKRLVALTVAYRTVALAHPHHFRLMYDEALWRACEAPDDAHFRQPAVLDRIVEARNRAFGAFARAVADGRGDGTLRHDRSAYVMARTIAALAHGLAMEALDERLPEADVGAIVSLAVEALRVRASPTT